MFRKLHELQGLSAPSPLTLTVDGQAVQAEPGETVAGVMLRQTPLYVRTTPVLGNPRAPYCMMGVCFECLAIVDGVPSTQTCLVQVRDGMKVERQHGKRVVAFAFDADHGADDGENRDHRDSSRGLAHE